MKRVLNVGTALFLATTVLAGTQAGAQLADKKVLTLAAAKKMAAAAEGEATTSVALKRPSKAVEDIIAGGRNAFLGVKGMTPLQGGLPIMVDNKLVGAIGVSGVTSQQDEQIAKVGLEALVK